MIVLIGGQKGGTGKSTIATNLAVFLAHAGRDVLLLDADRQATTATWASERTQTHGATVPLIACVQKFGNIAQTITDLAKRYSDIVIDAGGRDSEELRSAMVTSQKLYSPFKPSQSDLWTAENLGALVALARGMNPGLEAFGLLSLAPTNPRIQEISEAQEMLKSVDQLFISQSVLYDRKVYRDALFEGLGVVEMNDEKAKNEIIKLSSEIYGVNYGQKTVQTTA